MERKDPSSSEVPTISRLTRVGGALVRACRDTWRQVSTTDLNVKEADLRASIAPTEFLPERVPDFPPMHDDNL